MRAIGRALVGLDRGGVVVALDADRDREPVTHVDDPGALARSDEHPRRLGREPLEVHLRGLVGAVFAPHDGVHRQFEFGGLPPEEIDDAGELVIGEAELAVEGLRRHRRRGYPRPHHAPGPGPRPEIRSGRARN
jgi:hypothetical protein